MYENNVVVLHECVMNVMYKLTLIMNKIMNEIFISKLYFI